MGSHCGLGDRMAIIENVTSMNNHIEGTVMASSQGAYDAYVQSAFNHLRKKQTHFLDTFKINDFDKWRWNQAAGTMLFTSARQLQLEAQIHVAGTWSKQSQLWQWAWANEGLNEKIKLASQGIKHLGVAFKFPKLTSSQWSASEIDCWKMTSILVKEINAIGAFRTPFQNQIIYVAIKNAKLVNRNKILNLFKQP